MSTTQVIPNRFEISDLEKDLLGRGAMGNVDRATDTQTGQAVAIKTLRLDVAATLPADVIAAAQERGRMRDLNTIVAQLLAELGEQEVGDSSP